MMVFAERGGKLISSLEAFGHRLQVLTKGVDRQGSLIFCGVDISPRLFHEFDQATLKPAARPRARQAGLDAEPGLGGSN
jgi:hypothetical protein